MIVSSARTFEVYYTCEMNAAKEGKTEIVRIPSCFLTLSKKAAKNMKVVRVAALAFALVVSSSEGRLNDKRWWSKVTDAVSSAGDAIGDVASDVVSGAGDAINTVGDVAGDAVDAFGDAINKVGDVAGDVIDGVGEFINDPAETIAKGACEVIKALDISFQETKVSSQPIASWGGWFKASGSYVTSGTLSLSDCKVNDKKVTLTFSATAKVEGGEVVLWGSSYDAPDITVPYAVQVLADLCEKVMVPTGVENFQVESISIGHPTFGEETFPSWFAGWINNYLGKGAKDMVNSVASGVVGGKSFGAC